MQFYPPNEPLRIDAEDALRPILERLTLAHGCPIEGTRGLVSEGCSSLKIRIIFDADLELCPQWQIPLRALSVNFKRRTNAQSARELEAWLERFAVQGKPGNDFDAWLKVGDSYRGPQLPFIPHVGDLWRTTTRDSAPLDCRTADDLIEGSRAAWYCYYSSC